MALESLGQNFILVVGEGCVLHGFEEKVTDQGLIIKGWAPQKLILEHRAIGGFVTHCGWNSILEGVIAGLPMLTWPLHAEQFYNEKLVTDVLKIGVQIGSTKWLNKVGNESFLTGKEEIMDGLRRLMTGEEAQGMRCRVRELKELARKAISEGGSSYSDLNALIGELKRLRCKN